MRGREVAGLDDRTEGQRLVSVEIDVSKGSTMKKDMGRVQIGGAALMQFLSPPSMQKASAPQ